MKKTFFRSLGILFAIVLQPRIATAQQALFFDSRTIGSSLITKLSQTSDGLLWIGTENGLVRYDGYHFVPAKTPNSQGERPLEITSLEACGDTLWVGTSRGLLRRSRTAGRFQAVGFPEDLRPRVVTLHPCDDGSAIVGTAGYSTFRIDASSLEAASLEGITPSADAQFISVIHHSQDSTWWVGGLHSHILRQRSPSDTITWTSPRGMVVAFAEMDGETLAVCQDGILKMSSTDAAPEVIAEAPEGAIITCAVLSHDGSTLYIGTRGCGLQTLSSGSRELQQLVADVNGLDLSRTRVRALLLDRDDNLWVGCQQKGLVMIPLGQKLLVQTWSFSLQQHPIGTCVASICPADSTDVLCVVPGGGVYRFSDSGRLIAHPQAPAGAECLIRDSQQHYWLGTTNALYAYDPATEEAQLKANVSGERVNLIHELADRRHLALSLFGAGMALYDKRTGRLRTYSMQDAGDADQPPLCNDWIFAFDNDSLGRLWIATSSGCCYFDPATRRFSPTVASTELCTGLQVLPSGDVLIACDRGLLRYTTGGELLAEKDTRLLLGKGVSWMGQDDLGDIWISTADGICHYRQDSGELTDCSSAPGLLEREFVPGAGLILDQKVLLGTADGITLFDTEDLRDWQAKSLLEEEERAATRRRILLTSLLLLLAVVAVGCVAWMRHLRHQRDREKLHFLMSNINPDANLLTLNDLKRAVSLFVQTRQQQHTTYSAVNIAETLETPDVKSPDESLMERIIASVNKHLDDSEFTVEQLCSEAGISRAHLHRKMKELTGMPVSEFIRGIRLEQAARLLREGKLNVSSVAYSVGFGSVSHFSSTFKKHFNMSPREYVESQQPNNHSELQSENPEETPTKEQP